MTTTTETRAPRIGDAWRVMALDLVQTDGVAHAGTVTRDYLVERVTRLADGRWRLTFRRSLALFPSFELITRDGRTDGSDHMVREAGKS